MADLLTREQVMDLIEDELGVRPSVWAELYPDKAVEAPTAGLPAPVSSRVAGTSRYRPEEVRDWLENHPWRRRAAARQEFRRAAKKAPHKTEERYWAAVRAKEAGLSWSDIALICSEVEGKRITRQAAMSRYGAGSSSARKYGQRRAS